MGKHKERRLLADKYSRGECTPEENRLIQSWYQNLEDRGHVLPNDQEIEKESLEAADGALHQVTQLQRQNKIKRLLWQSGAAAAIILLVLNFWPDGEAKIIPSVTHMDIEELVTSTAKKRTLKLPDGSLVILNGASTVRYPRSFGNANREVELDGQAFFDVVPNPDKPFVVHTKDLRIKVLGTSFDVQAYDAQEQTVVRVATGKVAVSKNGAPHQQVALLLPGNQFGYDKKQKTGNIKTVDIQHISDWQRNAIFFEFATLEEICKELTRIYGIPIVVENKEILAERYHLNVKDESIDNILNLLSKSGKGFSYQNHQDQIIIN